MIIIETFNISTSMGTCFKQIPYLTPDELNEFNNIGYSGKNFKNEKISRVEYLNSLNKGTFNIYQTKHDGGDFIEEFLIIRAYDN